jgi:hypothetical protein
LAPGFGLNKNGSDGVGAVSFFPLIYCGDSQWGCPPDDEGADDACDVDVVDECDADAEEEADEREASKREPLDDAARALSAARDGGGGVMA